MKIAPKRWGKDKNDDNNSKIIIIIIIIMIIIIIIIVWSVYSEEIILNDYNAITYEKYSKMVLFCKYNWDHKKYVNLVFYNLVF